MKKNVVKAMSVGLSAITIASSLSVPVFAEESTEGGQPAEPSTASQEVETNVAEQTVVNDTAELNESYNGNQSETPAEGEPSTEGETQTTNEEKSTLDKVQDAVNTTNATFKDDDTYSFKVDIEVRDEFGNVVADENGEIKTEEKTVEGNYKETAADAQEAAKAAGEAIAAADADTKEILQAAEDMDDAAADANTAVGNAESAASDVTSAVNKAQQDANAAVVAVATDSQENAATLIATAQQSVADAQQTYDEKAQDLADAKSAYEDAIEDLNDAADRYQAAKDDATGDLADAEKDLATLQAKVDELEKAVENAKNALAESAAGVLAAADKEYADSDKTAADTNKYIAAVVENYYLVNNVELAEGQKLEVTVSDAVENQDAGLNLVSVTYNVLDESGAVVATNSFNLGYAINNGVVELFEKEVRYEYTTTDGKLISLSGTDIETEVTNGTAVRRYEYTDEEGKTTYLSQDQYDDLKTDEEKAKYTLGYVLLGNWGDADTKGLDSDETTYTIGNTTKKVVAVEEIATGEDATTVCYFDKNGNYIKVVTNYTTKYVYTYANGTQISADSFKSEAEAQSKANEAAASIQDVIDTLVNVDDYYRIGGMYVPKYSYNGKYKDTHTKITHWSENSAISAGKEAVKSHYKSNTYYGSDVSYGDNWSAYFDGALDPWHVSGSYTATYDKQYNSRDNNYTTWEAFLDKFRSGKKKEEVIAQFESEYNVVVTNAKSFNWDIYNATLYYLQLYSVNGTVAGTKYQSEQDAINAAINAAIADNYGANGGEKVIGIDENNSKLTTAKYYQYFLDYVTKTTAVDEAGANYTDTYTASVANEYGKVYRNVQNATDLVSGYTNQINGTNQTLSNYATLLQQLADAKAAVEAAQDKVTDIQGKIDDLGKDGAILSLQVLEWELRLADAQKAYDDAKATLDDAKAALNTATQAYSDKYPTIVPTTGGGATTTTGGAAPVVYATATTAAVAADEELEIPDDAVPAAGQARRARRARTVAANDNTTTIDEAETPLAGGDADDAVVEDTEDTTTVEEDLVPLAGEAQKGFFARTWWGWLLLIIAVLTGTTAYAKKKADAKKIK